MLSNNKRVQIIKEGLDKYNFLEKLYDSRSFNSRISFSFKNAKNKQIEYLSQHKIKMESNYSKLVHFAKEKRDIQREKLDLLLLKSNNDYIIIIIIMIV
jgi:hypothetical protein